MEITAAATVFQVQDLQRSLKYYREVLGFAEDFHFGPYAGIHLGALDLHLCAHATWKRPVGGGAISVFCTEVDALFSQLRERGAKIELEPTDEPYGMRDFVISDPDGNILTFGAPLT